MHWGVRAQIPVTPRSRPWDVTRGTWRPLRKLPPDPRPGAWPPAGSLRGGGLLSRTQAPGRTLLPPASPSLGCPFMWVLGPGFPRAPLLRPPYRGRGAREAPPSALTPPPLPLCQTRVHKVTGAVIWAPPPGSEPTPMVLTPALTPQPSPGPFPGGKGTGELACPLVRPLGPAAAAAVNGLTLPLVLVCCPDQTPRYPAAPLLTAVTTQSPAPRGILTHNAMVSGGGTSGR